MIYRWMIWHDEAGAELQVTLAMLTPHWEPFWEATAPCGPFQPLDEQRAWLMSEAQAWVALYGLQLELL